MHWHLSRSAPFKMLLDVHARMVPMNPDEPRFANCMTLRVWSSGTIAPAITKCRVGDSVLSGRHVLFTRTTVLADRNRSRYREPLL